MLIENIIPLWGDNIKHYYVLLQSEGFPQQVI